MDDQFLTFAQRILNAGGANIYAFFKVATCNFLKWQKAVTVFAVVNETGLKARLDAGDDTFVNIAFTLFAAGDFDIEVDEFLSIDDRNAQFFLVRCIKQHSLHERFLRLNGAP